MQRRTSKSIAGSRRTKSRNTKLIIFSAGRPLMALGIHKALEHNRSDRIIIAPSDEDLIRLLRQSHGQQIIILDMDGQDAYGTELIAKIHRVSADVPVIALMRQQRSGIAVQRVLAVGVQGILMSECTLDSGAAVGPSHHRKSARKNRAHRSNRRIQLAFSNGLARLI